MYDAYGADTLRLYLMATGPLDASRPWETRDVVGMYRFLQRLWRNVVDEETGATSVVDEPRPTTTTRKLLHRTIDVVRTEMEALRFNTAIAKLIELNNHVTKLGRDAARGRRGAGADGGAARAPRRRGAVAAPRPRGHASPTCRCPTPTRRCWSTTPSSTRCRSTARCAATSRCRRRRRTSRRGRRARRRQGGRGPRRGDADQGHRRPRPDGQRGGVTVGRLPSWACERPSASEGAVTSGLRGRGTQCSAPS